MNPIDQMHALRKKLEELEELANETKSDQAWMDWNTAWNEFGSLYAKHGRAFNRDLKLSILLSDASNE